MLTLTLVIPVYNEEHQIKACLESVKSQTVMPDEVIVVDNNCTDRTIEIAEKYSFARIITESSQGRGYARTAGFNVATSDILGRVDANSILDAHWVERVKNHFSEDRDLQGVTGIGSTSFFPGIHFWRTTLFARAYYWFVHSSFRTITMWGATMAIRKSAWDDVRADVCLDDSVVHEDQDVSLWMAAKGHKIAQRNNILIKTGGQTYRYLPKLIHYARLYESTKRLHQKNGNLNSPKLVKLKYPQVLLGMIGAVSLSGLLLVGSVLFFPFDYVMIHSRYKKEWLE